MFSELQEQIEVVRELKAIGLLYCAVPNGGKRHRGEAIKLKASGTVAGVPDILIFDAPPNGGAVGTALEMKRADRKMGSVSKAQKYWLAQLEERGWLCLVGFGADDAFDKLKAAGYKVRF